MGFASLLTGVSTPYRGENTLGGVFACSAFVGIALREGAGYIGKLVGVRTAKEIVIIAVLSSLFVHLASFPGDPRV
jgi:hypothetical protein